MCPPISQKAAPILRPTELLETAYRKYIHFWTNLARTAHISEDEAKDIVHTVLYCTIRNNSKEFESIEHVRNYVAKGVLNRAIQLKKKNDRNSPWREQVEIQFAVSIDLSGIEDEGLGLAFRKCLLRLPKRDYEVLKHRFYSGLRFAEISSLLGIPISTLKSREDAAIRKMRTWLRKMGY
ncbi:MAG: sigma-70 family RNA polymerase sigma factor [Bacteroidota bacterium]